MFSQLRIGQKLAVQAGAGVLLVVGLVANQQWSSWTVSRLNVTRGSSATVVEDVLRVSAIAATAQIVNRDIRLATTVPEVDKGAARLPQLLKEGEQLMDDALANAAIPANRERLAAVRSEYAAYIDALAKIAQTQRDRIGLWSRQIQIATDWDKSVEALGHGASFPGRMDTERHVMEADEALKSARSATWRAQTMEDESLVPVVEARLGQASSELKDARATANDPALAGKIDALAGLVGQLRDVMKSTLDVSSQQLRLFKERSTPLRDRVAGLLSEIEQTANARADAMADELGSAIVRASSSASCWGFWRCCSSSGRPSRSPAPSPGRSASSPVFSANS